METPAIRPSPALKRLGIIALVAPLFVILAAALWYAAKVFLTTEGPPMPAHGYIAMTLGVVFSLVVGCGLMTLVFYSSRHGYDDLGRDESGRDESDRYESGRRDLGRNEPDASDRSERRRDRAAIERH